MSGSTDELITRLAADARPVRRLSPPLHRAALWLAITAAVALAVLLRFADPANLAPRMAYRWNLWELGATLATGLAGAIAAFHLSLPDRPRRWLLLPVPPLILWLGSSGYGCWREWLIAAPSGYRIGHSGECFMFIVTVSLPMAIGMLIALRRARPIDPVPATIAAGLGVAGIAAFLLAFFHPFEVTLLDLGFHAAAVALVTGIFAVIGRSGLAGR